MLKKLFQGLVSISFVIALLEGSYISQAYGAALPSREESVRFDLRRDIKYKKQEFSIEEDDSALFTVAQRPIKSKSQAVMVYKGNPESFIRERILREGRDGRSQVPLTEKWPHCLHGQMSMEFDEREYGGSGVLVGPHHFLTAGHCVYDPETSTLAQNIRVHLGLNGDVAPFNEALGVRVYLYQKWIESQDKDYDIALVVLNRSIGHETGWAGLLCLEDAELEDQVVHVTGYPGDKGFKTMWTMDNQLGRIENEQLYYQIDTYGGQSGGAIWIKKWGTPHVVGVHTTGGDASIGNFGVRLSRRKIHTIATHWIADTLEIASTSNSTSGGTPRRRDEPVPTASLAAAAPVPAYGSASGGAFVEPASAAPTATGGSRTTPPYIPVARPLAPAVPDIARGYEEVYLRFIKGVLIYKPNPANDDGRIDIPFASLPNPLEGTFDLSRCGDAGRYITFSTGYRKGMKKENIGKVEVWITPKFYVERNLDTTAGHLKPVMGRWTQPIGLFWTWGGYDRMDYYDYLLTETPDALGAENNYEKNSRAARVSGSIHNAASIILRQEKYHGTKNVITNFN